MDIAGVNHEQFMQMTSQPGFFEGYKDLVKRTLVVMRYPRMVQALVTAAEAGDTKAFALIDEKLGGNMMDGLGEYAQAALHGDRHSVVRMIDREIEELEAMKASLLMEDDSREKAEAMIEETNTKAVESLE